MIYIDVTGACLLPLQSGIPRTTRGLYQVLADHAPEKLTAIFWQPFRASYTELSPRARTLLRDPFAAGVRDRRTPRDSTLPLLWASFSDLLGPWPRALPLQQRLNRDDTLIITSIFPDNRLAYLERLTAARGRTIAIFHDAIPMRDPNVARWEKKRHLRALQILSRLDVVIAVSQAAANDLQELWREHQVASRASVIVIPWPISFSAPRPAFALELIGCEDEARESGAILKAVFQLRQHGRPVSWRGHVTESELHRAYQNATFTVFPSLAEGFGLPLIESFWHGRAVVCSDRDAVGERSRDGGCLITDVKNASTLATAIASLLQNQTKCAALSREAYARPVRTWSDYWEDLKPILENR
jgi:glycosyltransferase involved in cell wall biosynthesis